MLYINNIRSTLKFNQLQPMLPSQPTILLLLSTFLLPVLTGCNLNSTAQPQPTPTITPAQSTAVVVLGKLEPQGNVIKLSVPNAQDSRVDRLLVKEGDRVRANQVIAILQGIDRRDAEVRDAQAEVALRQAELEKAISGDAKQAQISAQQATIDKLQAQLSSSIRQRQAAIASAQARLKNAETDRQRKTTLVREGAIAQAELDQSQEEQTTAIATLREKEADLDQVITTLQAEIRAETAKLAELKEVRPTDVAIAQAQLDKAKILVEQRLANLRDAEVRVPVAGQILKINTRVGEQVNISQGIVELAQTDQMYAIADVPELEIGKIYKGQSAKITSENGGFKGELRGTVEQIGLQVGRQTTQEAGGITPMTDQNTRVIAVKIRITPADSAKVSQFTAMQVRIRLDVEDQS
jgi:HlyD family secretion protein